MSKIKENLLKLLNQLQHRINFPENYNDHEERIKTGKLFKRLKARLLKLNID